MPEWRNLKYTSSTAHPSHRAHGCLGLGGRRLPVFKRMVCYSRQCSAHHRDLLIFPTQAHVPVSPPHTSSCSNRSWSLICVPETALTFAKELVEGGGKNKKDIHQSPSSSQDQSLELQASFTRTPIIH